MKPSRCDLAALYVLDLLAPEERVRFEADFIDNPELSQRVSEWEVDLEAAIRSLSNEPPSPELWTKLDRQLSSMASARAGEPAVESPSREQNGKASERRAPRKPSPFPWAAWLRWGLATSIALSLSTLAVQSLKNSSSPKIIVVTLLTDRSTVASLPLEKSPSDADGRFVQLATLAETYLRGASSSDPGEENPASGNRAFALFDPTSQQGFIAIQNLPPLPNDRHYQLWLVAADNGILHNAGTLPLAGGSTGLFSFDTSALLSGKLTPPLIQITAERNRDALKPEGPVILGGL